MKSKHIHRHSILLLPDSSRVIVRPFIPANTHRIAAILGRALALTEEEAEAELAAVIGEFEARHYDVEALILEQYMRVQERMALT